MTVSYGGMSGIIINIRTGSLPVNTNVYGSDFPSKPIIMTRKQHGRRARKKRQRECRETTVQSVTLSHEPQFVALRRWLQQRGFSSKLLVPAHFSDTGRGLMTLQPIKADDLVISLPEKCLLTTSTVLRSYIGEYIERWKPPVSPLLALCAFLISERHFGQCAEWKPYIDVLPQKYTCPAYFSDEVINLLPGSLSGKALEQRAIVQELHSSSLDFFSSLQPLFSQPVESVFTYDALRWAWCSVNTRTVYMEHQHSPYMSRERNVYALAPYLDLLNHCPAIQVKASFSHVNRCYEIRSVQGCKRFQQAFICYGPHDNQRLLLEYGFVAPGNPHSVVYVDQVILQQCICITDINQLAQKLLFLKKNDFLANLTLSLDGPSWRLMTALRLLSLKTEQYPFWKSVLLGAVVSQDREEWSVDAALRLCHYLMVDNTRALDKISQLTESADSSLQEQLAVVECLRREEQGILGLNQKQLLPSRQNGMHNLV
ncbi:SET domain-containing protein 4 isoform X1 [Salvelinus sp. IW2-2015]|uniref:SET domain-containing protein 4 isoform X1 n=2 Tax=Salvelinus sp. IW2-2015 TaxID=2691554 RepID=UPI000CEA9E2C|nr:SET domain-containing protein 4 isoform X1 [Salvelinus alpinus]